MKYLFAIGFIFLLNISAQAQSQEPDFEFEPHVYNVEDSTMGELLPSETAYLRVMKILYKVEAFRYLTGTASPMTLQKSDCLIINTGDRSPLQSVSINLLEVRKSKRRYRIARITSFSGLSEGDNDIVDFRYKKLSSGSVIIPLSNMEPGEYVMSFIHQDSNAKSLKVYTFSISE